MDENTTLNGSEIRREKAVLIIRSLSEFYTSKRWLALAFFSINSIWINVSTWKFQIKGAKWFRHRVEKDHHLLQFLRTAGTYIYIYLYIYVYIYIINVFDYKYLYQLLQSDPD